MFVVSFKSSKVKLIALAAAGIALIAALVFAGTSKLTRQTVASGGIDYSGADNESRVRFISGFGWDIDTEPLEVREVLIPNEFDEVYSKYNEIQKAQKLDLEKYKGARVKRWTYAVNNYDGMGDKAKGTIRINLLVYDGRIIGGDVCSVELDGFMHGFEKPAASPSAAV